MGLDPLTMGLIGVGGLSAISSVAQGRAEAKGIAEKGTLEAERLGKQAKEMSMENARRLERQRMNFLSSGVELSGTAYDLLSDTVSSGLVDLEEVNTDLSRMKSYYDKSAKSSIKSGLMGGITSLASAGLSAYSYQSSLAIPKKKPLNTGGGFFSNLESFKLG